MFNLQFWGVVIINKTLLKSNKSECFAPHSTKIIHSLQRHSLQGSLQGYNFQQLRKIKTLHYFC